MKNLTLALLFLALTATLHAATLTADSSAQVHVQAKVTAAAPGDTVIIPASPSSVTWTSTIVLQRGITIQGPGRDNLTIFNSGASFRMCPNATAVTNEEVMRITGITFDGSNSAASNIQISGAANNGTKPWRSFAVGDCRFKNNSTISSGSGAVNLGPYTQHSPAGLGGQMRGVIYSNIFDRVCVVVKCMGSNDGQVGSYSSGEWKNAAYAPPPYGTFMFGTADSIFFEDNTIFWSSPYTGQAPGWIETGQGGRIVIRYNNWNMANAGSAASQTEVFDIHGFQNYGGSSPQAGSMRAEFYGNTVTNMTTAQPILHRGSQGLFYNNSYSGTSTGAHLTAQQYGEDAPSGQTGCDNITTVIGGQINNTYAWNNFDPDDGSILPMQLGAYGVECGVTEASGAFRNYNPSFNGSSGIGRGAAAPSGSNTAGVGYWQASPATPTTSSAVIQAGTFWRGNGGTSWSVYYQPYTYPHPLRAGGGGGDTTAPVLSTATIQSSGTQIALLFSELVNQGPGGTGGWTLTGLSGGAATLTPAAALGNGTNTWTYDLSRTVNSNETGGMVNYTQPGSGLEDTSANDLASLSGVAVVNNSTQGQVAIPTVNLAAGSYYGAQTISASTVTSGADVRYTTDGSTPTSSSPIYSTQAFTAPVTLKLIGTKSGSTNSAVVTNVYEINEWSATGSTQEDVVVPAQIDSFAWSFKVTPSSANSYTVVSLNPGPRADNPDAVAVWFTDTGVIQCRNGSSYAAINVVNAVPGVTYTFSGVVDPATDTWDMSVTPAGGATTVLATDYAFRQAETELDTMTMFTATGISTVEQMSFGEPAPPGPSTPVGTVNATNLTIGAP